MPEKSYRVLGTKHFCDLPDPAAFPKGTIIECTEYVYAEHGDRSW